MTTWTVISTLERHWDGTYSGSPLAAIPGHADVYGIGVHAATVQASTADTAMCTVREAFRIAGTVHANCDRQPEADRWTVIGTATNGVCASHSVVAVVAGEHTVSGQFESPTSHRWERVVDAPDAAAAETAGWKAADDMYSGTWN